MRLPKDLGEWNDAHFYRAIQERDAAFRRYEAKVDFADRAASDKLYATFFRKAAIASDVSLVLFGKPVPW